MPGVLSSQDRPDAGAPAISKGHSPRLIARSQASAAASPGSRERIDSSPAEDRKQFLDGSPLRDGHLCRSFFLEPQLTFHRRYEALRAVFIEDRPVAEVAAQFGSKPTALQVMLRRFHARFRRGQVPPFSFPTVADGHPADGVVKTGTALRSPPARTSAS